MTLLEAVAGLLVTALVAAAVMPAFASMRAEALTAAGARHLAVTLRALRWKSVAQGRGHGMYFVEDESGWCWYEVRDGNGNGLRTAEVGDGTDPTLAGPRRLEDVASGVGLGFPPGEAIPRIPPGSGWIADLADPIRIGNTNLLAFSPSGTSSSGTLYLTDGGKRLYAVVLYGRTAKIRVWRYAEANRQWTS
jgi:type II secretory pathway pseudopilin PulG